MESVNKKASEVAAMLDLKPHPEGGFYSETFRDDSILLTKSQLPPPCNGSSQTETWIISIAENYLKLVHVLLVLSFQDALVDRPVSTAIYFLLPSGNVSRIHRIPCAEIWHFYMGEPLTVFELTDEGMVKLTVLGLDLEAGQRPQYTVPGNVWFGLFPTKDIEYFSLSDGCLVTAPKRDPEQHFSLVGCTCSPGFQFEDFEMATASMLVPLAPHIESFLRFLTPVG